MNISIRDYIDSRGYVKCWNCKKISYQYDYRFYPRISLLAFMPIHYEIPMPKGNPDCPGCNVNLLDLENGNRKRY